MELLKSRDLVVDCFDRWGKTPLQDAVEHDHPEIVELLRQVYTPKGTTMCNHHV